MKLENFLGIEKATRQILWTQVAKVFGSKGFGNMRSMPSQNRFLARKARQQARELKETSKHTINKDKHAIFLEDTKDLK